MPFPALLLVVATLLPLAACITLLFVGKRMGTPFAGYFATSLIAISFICSGWAMLRWLGGGNDAGQPFGYRSAPINPSIRWLPVGSPDAPNGVEQDHPGFLEFGLYVDSLTVAFFVTITLTAMLVHIFALRSLRRELQFPRFFASLSLACFGTLALVLSGTVLQMTVFLELAGFAAAMLIGFRSDRRPAVHAGGKMFVVNRLGDVGLVFGLGMLLRYVGNLSLPELWTLLGTAGEGAKVILPGGQIIPPAMMTAIGVALFLGAAVRCAQFPLHVWAGDVADGTATGAATVFAITLSVGGLYLIARLFPVFTPSARLMIAIIGVTTLTMGALVATVQTDIKKVLAFSAASQLGYMVLGIGVGSWVGAMFHLIAFGFFQVLLFLTAGAVIRAARGQTDLSRYGGLFRQMPVTALAAAVGVFSISGAGWGSYGLSGFHSRGLILRNAAAFASLAGGLHRSRAYWAPFLIPAAVTCVTAFGMTRWWMLIFAARPRDRRLHDHAREAPTLFWPGVVLAAMTALAGNWLGVRDMVESSVFESREVVRLQSSAARQANAAAPGAFQAVWLQEETPDETPLYPGADTDAQDATTAAMARADDLFNRWVWIAVVTGIGAGAVLYLRGPKAAGRLARTPPLSWIHTWLTHRMYFDDLYESLLVVPFLSLARGAAWVDRRLCGAPATEPVVETQARARVEMDAEPEAAAVSSDSDAR